MNYNNMFIKQNRLFVNRSYQSQRGIILISCIIFLLLILMLLKISLSSSRISEQKSGIDHEIMTAQESAQLALREAENKILSVVPKAQLSSCKDAAATSSECKKNFKKAVELAWTISSLPGNKDVTDEIESSQWSDKSKNRVTNAYNDKVFTSDDRTKIRKAAKEIKNQAGFFYKDKSQCSDAPLWYCVNWNGENSGEQYFSNKKITASLPSIEANSILKLGKKYDVAPRYIIERFLPGEVDMPDDAGLLFRITAVGFGQSGGSDENVTSSVFQANYVL